MTPRETLLTMLSYRRPAGSKAERKFIRRFLEPLGCKPDGYGNMILRIGTAPILWSSHTDTVHSQGGRQAIVVTPDNVARAGVHNCLGADCTTGVWLMTEMIKDGVEGLYVFHREEEVGGNGSEYIRTKTPELLADIQYAIAFDRYGDSSIITHQWGGRSASQSFAYSLADVLGWSGLDFKPDSGGTFTDTANYVDVIPECSNISVGYYGQHTKRESQDLEFADRLLETILGADFTRLVADRTPAKASYYDDDAWDTGKPYGWRTEFRSGYDYGATGSPYDFDYRNEVLERANAKDNSYDALLALIKKHPDAVAAYLDDLGLADANDIRNYIDAGYDTVFKKVS